jgi:hypothetical protein
MDPMFTLLWQQYRAWADTSGHLKEQNARWRRRVLILTIVGTAFAALGPHAVGAVVARALPWTGAVALALATYFGKELLDAKHDEAWTRARAAAEAYKSESCKYLVQIAPYDGPERTSRLKARMDELSKTINGQPKDFPEEQTKKNLPTQVWTIDDYLTERLNDQVKYYSDRAADYAASMNKGRAISLTLGGVSVLLGAATGATPQGATFSGAVLGVVTTVAASIGAYYQAGHYEALSLKYRETAQALRRLAAEFTSPGSPRSAAEFVTSAETIMQAENAAWLTEMTTVKPD